MADEEINAEELAGLLDDVTSSPAPEDLYSAPAATAVAEGSKATTDPLDAEVDGSGDGEETGKNENKKKKKRKSKRDKRREEKRSKRSKHEQREGDDDEDEDEEDEDDDDDAGSEESYKRSKYIIDAAESGSSDGDDDDFVADDDEVEEGYEDAARVIPPYQHNDGDDDPFGQGNLTNDQLAEQIQQRYHSAKQKKQTGAEVSAPMYPREMEHSTRFIASMLPQPSDPKVFAVKCRPRMARVLVARIVNKCYAYRIGNNDERKPVDLGIISVFSLDHVKEYIYVEAHRKLFVENALNGLNGLFRFSITQVPPTELMKMMERRTSSDEEIRVGAFVRLRQRPYRADLAQVVSMDASGQRLTCKVVPREDFVGKSFNKPESRLPPKFFVARQAVDVKEMSDGTFIWGMLAFDSEGYLLKTVSHRMVISGDRMEQPTAPELAVFFHNDRANVRKAVLSGAARAAATTDFSLGESLYVASGQLRGTIGTIIDLTVNGRDATLRCNVPGRKDPLKIRVELSNCIKHFVEGTHVIVESGAFAGESGTVVKMTGDVIRVFSDRSAYREFEVSSRECRQSKLTGSGAHSFGSWRLMDLVVLADSSGVACITRCNRADITVLTDHNETRTVTPAMIKGAVQSSGRQTMDQMLNPITRGVEILVPHGAIAPQHVCGQTGRVEQLFSKTLFVCFKSVKENCGIVAISNSSAQVIGARTTNRKQPGPKHLPLPDRKPHHATRAELSMWGIAENAGNPSEEWGGNSEWYDSMTPSGMK